MVKFIESMAEYETLIEVSGEKLVIIDFTATWCPPCKRIAPIFEKMADVNPDVVFVKVDVDDASDVAEHFGIKAMPTFKFIKLGKEVNTLEGADPVELEKRVALYK